jgi:hypothetical protein
LAFAAVSLTLLIIIASALSLDTRGARWEEFSKEKENYRQRSVQQEFNNGDFVERVGAVRLNLIFCATLTRVSRDNAPALQPEIKTISARISNTNIVRFQINSIVIN